jgi:branched-chain amino acid transport system permease protein
LSVATPALLSSAVSLPGGSFPAYRIAVIVIAILVMAALSLWLRYSRIGLYVRASSTDPDTTGMQGVDTERLGALVVGLGAGLAGLAGAIASPLLTLSPSMGGSIVIDCFIVVITGGLGSFAGAFIAAMVIGEMDNFGVIFFPEFASMIPLIVMVLLLAWRPAGLVRTGV